MPIVGNDTQPRILYSCYSNINREGEQFIADHIFSYLLAGSQTLYMNGQTYHFKEGDFRFFKKNQLCKFVKVPPVGGEFKSVTVKMDQHTLHSISAEHDLYADAPCMADGALLLKPNPLFKNYIESLTPYVNGGSGVGSAITTLKVKEAVMLLLQTNPILKNALFDFTEPGKIDLEAYMSENYKFNVTIDRFAYLTGRSLATFKRDFERIYHTSPNKWLQQKRLNDAYYLIREKGQKTSEVYMEVGFKDLSHFSFAFKKAFGIAPSQLAV